MPESSDSTPPSSSVLDAFGANEWLVDEMYEQYQRDPNSVDKAWWDFFESVGKGGNGLPDGDTGAGRHAGPAKTEKAQEKERQRLFRIIEDLVVWENSTNEKVLQQARDEIWQSWRRACAENADHSRA